MPGRPCLRTLRHKIREQNETIGAPRYAGYSGAIVGAIADSRSTPAHAQGNPNFPTVGLSNVAQSDTDTNWIGSLAWS